MVEENETDDRQELDDKEFEKILREMEKIVGHAFHDSLDELKRGKTCIKGFSMRLGPSGSPQIDELHESLNTTDGVAPEIGENGHRLSITLELPPVQEDDIIVNVEERKVEVIVENHDDCHHVIHLPHSIIPESTAITFKNRVLDIELDKLD